ncbi:MAG TPA: PAS domain S-box protein [Dehalococcoidia bacterium]|jgi:two-component system NtrC family sensor kinase|nr:PAS domain S-box protein [Dehalococcoidia bacterium]
MKDEDKTREQLLRELAQLRQRLGELEQANKALLESENEYRTIFETTTAANIVIEEDTTISLVNRQAEKLSGYSKEEIEGKKSWMEFVASGDLERMRDYHRLRRADPDAAPKQYEFRFIDRNGDVRDVLVNVDLIPGTKRSVASLIDITERKRAEEELRKFKTIADQAPYGVTISTIEGELVYVNKSYAEMHGYSPEELIGKHFSVLYTKEQMKTVRQLRERLLREGSFPGEEVWHKRKDGTVFPTLMSAHLVRDERGTPLYLTASVLDITERKRMEEEVLKFKAISDQAGYGASITTLEGEFTYVNDAYARMHGYEPSELIGKHYSLLYTDESLRYLEKVRSEQILKGKFVTIELWRKRKDGTVFPSLTTAGSIKDEKGALLFTVAITIDITERKKMEEALQRSEERFRELAELLPETIFETDREGKLTFANRNALNIFGYSQEDIDAGLDSVQMLVPEDRPRARENLKRILNRENLGCIQYTAQRKDGSSFPALIYSCPIIREDEVTGIRGILTDISEQEKIQEQLILADRLASLGELASGIAHELNNPLTSIVGFSDLLSGEDLPERVKEDLKVINKEAHRAAGIVKNLLAFARKHPETKEPVDINEVIRQVLELRAYEQKVHNIEVKTHLAPDLPKVMANAFQLQQVFLNIIINAEYFMIEAHKRGTLTITTERVGDIVRASFADDGPGIPKENLRRIFNPFFTTKEVGKGTGLGLSICHGIVAEHGGRIYAESELGKGATFTVELPVAGSDEGGEGK